jgi:ADP-heptose:LPS heptosyltransferase
MTITKRGWPLRIAWTERARDAGVSAICRLAGCIARPFLRAPRGRWRAPQRILVLKPCCMGDLLFTTPLLAAVKAAYPKSHLTVATSAWCAPVLAENAHVDAIYDVPARIGVRDAWTWARRLRAERFDLALVPDRSPVLGIVVALAGIPRRAGLDSGGRGFLYTDRVPIAPDDYQIHEAVLYSSVGTAVGAPPLAGQGTEYRPPTTAQEVADALIADRGWQAPLWVIHPGGGVNPGMTLTPKRWPAARVAALADRLLDAHGGTVLLLGTDSDADAVRAVSTAMHQPAVDLTGMLDFGAWQAVARHAALYIGNDTGMTHCALAGGAPTICIFGPTDARQYGLFGGSGINVSGRMPWSPCFRRGRLACTCGTIRCMDAVTVEAVRGAAEQLIGVAP